MTELEIQIQLNKILDDWLVSCTYGNEISRNTVAMGIVVFDHLRRKCPVTREETISSRGEVVNSRSGLKTVFARYGIEERYLKECTTRQSHQDGQKLFEMCKWGAIFCDLTLEQRDNILTGLIGRMTEKALDWLNKKSLRLDVDRRNAPSAWISEILDSGRKNKSGGVVEQHLVGAKLVRRFKNKDIENQPAHAGDQQTDRPGDFAIDKITYHITASPGRSVIQKCKLNIQVGQYPILLVPAEQVQKAKNIADDEGIGNAITVISIEDFLALNIIEIATEEQKPFFDILSEIIDIYNKRLKEVETNMSLQIEVK